MQKKAQKKDIGIIFCNLFLILMIFGLPLIITDGFFNVTETKSIYFYVLSVFFIALTGINFLIKALTRKLDKELLNLLHIKISALDICFIAFGFFVVLSGLLSQYQQDVWFGVSSRYQGVVTVILYIAIYFAVSRNYRFSQGFLLAAIAAISVVSAFGVLNCFDIDLLGIYSSLSAEYKKDFISTIGNINFYSSFMCLMFPLVLCGFCSTKEKTSRIIYTTALVIASFGMMVTGSESFVIGFVFSVLVFPLFLMREAEKLKKFLFGIIIILCSAQMFRIIYYFAPVKNIIISELLLFLLHPAVMGLLVAICLIVIVFLSKKPDSIKIIKPVYIAAFTLIIAAIALLFILANTKGTGRLDKYFRITQYWGTLRGSTWIQCVENFNKFSLKEKLFGIGPETLYHILFSTGADKGKRLDQAHNEYLQYLLTTGVFGLMSYFSVLIGAVVTVVRKLKHNIFSVAVLLGLVAYWFQAVVNIAQPFTTPLMFIFIAVIGGLNYNKKQEITF